MKEKRAMVENWDNSVKEKTGCNYLVYLCFVDYDDARKWVNVTAWG